jgi:hypothetical protein
MRAGLTICKKHIEDMRCFMQTDCIGYVSLFFSRPFCRFIPLEMRWECASQTEPTVCTRGQRSSCVSFDPVAPYNTHIAVTRTDPYALIEHESFPTCTMYSRLAQPGQIQTTKNTVPQTHLHSIEPWKITIRTPGPLYQRVAMFT